MQAELENKDGEHLHFPPRFALHLRGCKLEEKEIKILYEQLEDFIQKNNIYLL